ncbi:ABC transporter permease [Arhodomonas sp. AD133]|uniref:ABC transporter permease n=1 Tax=Arhodomonas sp. AD133 TaxID=3415009 RepID=UPI003EBD0263
MVSKGDAQPVMIPPRRTVNIDIVPGPPGYHSPPGQEERAISATARPPTLEHDATNRRARASGDWQLDTVPKVMRAIAGLPAGQSGWRLDLSGLGTLDTAGAVCLQHVLRRLGDDAQVTGARDDHRALLALVTDETAERPPPPRSHGPLARLGRLASERVERGIAFLTFTGELAADTVPRLATPQRIRWRQIVAETEKAGINALPIVGLLAFLMGVVMAYQGGTVLRAYGANVFLVELVGITMLREMAPLLAAIIVAGRTGSSYAAEIGTMRITEEVDALRTFGVTPFEMLVLPKVVALAVVMPLLSLWADILGVFGGMVVANSLYGVSFANFIDRLPQAVPVSMFWSGIGKAPAFALLIAMVGCFHGFRVRGSAAEVGRATTLAVVQAIFMVIIADALFSIAFQQLGI